jgi:hypothetical protein
VYIQDVLVNLDQSSSVRLPDFAGSTELLMQKIRLMDESVHSVEGVGQRGERLFWSKKTGWIELEVAHNDLDEAQDPLIGLRVVSTDADKASVFGFGKVASVLEGSDGKEVATCTFNTAGSASITLDLNIDEILALPSDIKLTTLDDRGLLSEIDVTDMVLSMPAEDIAQISDGLPSHLPDTLRNVIEQDIRSVELANSISTYFGGQPVADIETGRLSVPQSLLNEVSDNLTQCRADRQRELGLKATRENIKQPKI